jgi:hypothetical protein
VSLPWKGFLIASSAILYLPACSVAAPDIALHGFLQGNYTLSTASENPGGGEFKWAEETAQVKLDGESEPYYMFIKAEASYDHIGDDAGVDLREGYLDLVFQRWDLRLGRQVITWGLGDLIFITDIYPKDYEAFYAGRPLEYLKKGVDGLKAGMYLTAVNIEGVLVPFFEPDTFPREERFHSSADRRGDEPGVTFEDAEVATRAYRSLGGADAALYFYRGFFRTPSLSPEGGYFYPELSVYGMSIEGRAAGGIIGLETGYYDSRQDREGDDPSVANSSTRFLAAYKRQLAEDLTAGLQYYGEYMRKYSSYEKTLPPGSLHEDRLYQLATLRLTRFLMHQNLRLSMFMFRGLSDEDYMLTLEAKYKFTDNVWAAIGGNVFGGKAGGRFGRLDRNDNSYLQVRYEF